MSGIDNKKISSALKASTAKVTMFADGFVDEVWEIISERADLSKFSVYSKMTDFAGRIMDSGTGGVGLELVRKRRAFGGFTANIGYAAARLGVGVSMVGVYGKDKIDPVFDEAASLCRVYSVADPAVTYVFEFDDGKILMSHMEAVQDIRWESIVSAVSMETLLPMLAESDLIGVGYWSLLPAFDEILENAAALLPSDGKTRRFFFDFADFRKRDNASLAASLKKLSELNDKFPMLLSVNEHEAAALFSLHGETFDGNIAAKADSVRKKIGLAELIIHAPTFACAAAHEQPPAYAESVYCEKPVRTAGAGDSFNGAYMAATLAGLSLPERLHTANSAVGYFIRNAAYPELKNLF